MISFPRFQSIRPSASSVKKYAKLFVAKRIRFTMTDGEIWVHSDSKGLGYIIDQILSNSLIYTDDHGAIAGLRRNDSNRYFGIPKNEIRDDRRVVTPTHFSVGRVVLLILHVEQTAATALIHRISK